MKQWVKKLLTQLDIKNDTTQPVTHIHLAQSQNHSAPDHINNLENLELSEDRATLLYLIDLFSKNLIEIDSRPVRKVREIFDEFAKGLARPHGPHTDKLLFRFRQFFSGYRIQEYSYLQKTFEDFKSIIWDFADQLNENIVNEKSRDSQVLRSLNGLREAVEANSIDELKVKSREFIDFYIEVQNKNDERRADRLANVQKSLQSVKQKLVEINQEARRDHLTGAYNRKSFDEMIAKTIEQSRRLEQASFLVALDIDYFKKINDVFGHDAGDQVLKHLVTILNSHFKALNGFVARVGGEEFTVILTGVHLPDLHSSVESLIARIRKEVIVHSDAQIRFTISAGLAELGKQEPGESWIKRSDVALYEAKNSGRDRFITAPPSKTAA